MSSRRTKFSLSEIADEEEEDLSIPRTELVSRPISEATEQLTVLPVEETVPEAVAVQIEVKPEEKGSSYEMIATPALQHEVQSVSTVRSESTSTIEKVDRVQLLAEQRFRPVADKRPTSLRLEPWLDDALNRRHLELKLQGYRKITREAIIVDALIQYLGVNPPE